MKAVLLIFSAFTIAIHLFYKNYCSVGLAIYEGSSLLFFCFLPHTYSLVRLGGQNSIASASFTLFIDGCQMWFMVFL